MKTLVMKFGGSSVKDTKSFLRIAEIICERSKVYKSIVCVVSAMGDTTNHLLKMAKEVHPNPPKREEDMLVSVGERISISLLAMALDRLDKKAISFTGSQSGIITCAKHSDARIIDVRPTRIFPHLREGKIVIVAGFQGVGLNGEITTLGRGGSDTSAVALARGLGAEKVEFYKDVDGIYASDPKKNPHAQFYETLDYDAALKISSEVLHDRCLELAQKSQIPLHVLSFLKFKDNESIDQMGTKIEGESVEELIDEPCFLEGGV